MLTQIFLLCFSASVYTGVTLAGRVYETAEDGEQEQLIGGRKVTNTMSHPYLAQVECLSNDDNYRCGGSIISIRHVLTAAHCVVESYNGIIRTCGNTKVTTGSTFWGAGESFGVSRIHHRKNYGIKNMIPSKDIAVLALSRNLTPVKGVQEIINLPTAPVEVGREGKFAGWGLTVENFEKYCIKNIVINPREIRRNIDICDDLKETDLQIMHRSECVKQKIPIENDHLCVRDKKGLSTIDKGDSGGPLIVDGVVVGVASFGAVNFQAHKPNGFTNVYLYRSFIINAVNQDFRTFLGVKIIHNCP